jgi:hypothetical protein
MIDSIPTNARPRKFFVCYIGKNSKLEKRYGVLALMTNFKPPMLRLITKNQDLDSCARDVAMMNANPEVWLVNRDESDSLKGDGRL